MPDRDDAAAQWRDERRAAADVHAQALERRRAAESEQAARLIAEFVADALANGPAPVPLRARSHDGRRRYRTPLRGWYLRRNESVGVDTEGRYYVLTVPATLTGLVRGVQPEPEDPPLVLGRGARDGESIDLVDALRLARGR